MREQPLGQGEYAVARAQRDQRAAGTDALVQERQELAEPRIEAQQCVVRLPAPGAVGVPNAVDARENATLQKLLADALECESGHELQSTGFMAVSRPTGKRSFPMMVTPLMAAPPGSAAREAVVAIFISNPELEEAESGATSESLETLYDLTTAEAEIVNLLSRGHSLEEADTARGVSIHTARSHLKHAFAKTDTNRHGELVRLILTGVSSIRER